MLSECDVDRSPCLDLRGVKEETGDDNSLVRCSMLKADLPSSELICYGCTIDVWFFGVN